MRNILLVLLLIPFISGATISSSQVQFINNLDIAKMQANKEGKLYIVDFVATYCYLCKMMDETTFSDRRVTNYVEENYIPVKINVDDFDGFQWKQQYDIRLVPTIMIFNSNGEPIARYEESMGSARMLEVLEKHSKSTNQNTNNYHPTVATTTTNKPAPIVNTAPITKQTSYTTVAPTYTTTAAPTSPPVSRPTHTTAPIIAPSLESTPATGLFEFTVKEAPSSGYGVQIGVFAEYGNVLREVERLTGQFNTEILVNINQLNGRTVYKVIVGHFSTRQAAQSFQYNMAIQGTSGFIADLATLR